MARDATRRRVLYGTGALIATGALAGCSDGGNGNGDGGDVPQEIDEHLSDANGYDGSIDDQTGEDEVTVEVGTGDTGYGFSPAAVRVDVDATVVWEWTGQGGQHNVNAVDDSDFDFQSEYYEAEGETFEQTFDEAGNVLYECEPHSANGMLGAVEVVE